MCLPLQSPWLQEGHRRNSASGSHCRRCRGFHSHLSSRVACRSYFRNRSSLALHGEPAARAQTLSSSEGDNLLDCLSNLFLQIHSQKKKTGVIAPKRFVQRLKKDNELFRSYMHQVSLETPGPSASSPWYTENRSDVATLVRDLRTPKSFSTTC